MDKVKGTFKEVSAAIFPITIVVVLLQVTLVRLPLDLFLQFIVGVIFVSLGFFLFLLGVHAGLLPVGEMIGKKLPKTKKTWLIIGVGLMLGFAVTIAEPDVRVLAEQIDDVSGGAIASWILILSVAIGLSLFVGLAMARTVFSIPIHYLLAGCYTVVFILAIFVPKSFIPISFDAGGVTTGPMAVPFILALGVGVASVLKSNSSSSSDGFGLIGLASIGPIIAVMMLGVIFG
ncbi:DUF1538 domain-containing protein [Jeotgalibacillus campisalis]|uniref:DUF1538 domain-containing protein n=1 Tax=Jeotgalibacillus campisalis TaxID=220754 RepID=A0A0C2VHU8_9BACL|nr:DUF1538 domain-containing protein [Jeotgalibacillus campisalis]KIL48447.1 hypothetical protein KR50_14830 [Jeotgalibacillus campisalis]